MARRKTRSSDDQPAESTRRRRTLVRGHDAQIEVVAAMADALEDILRAEQKSAA